MHLHQSITACSNHILIYGSMEMRFHYLDLDSLHEAYVIQFVVYSVVMWNPFFIKTKEFTWRLSNWIRSLFMVIWYRVLWVGLRFRKRNLAGQWTFSEIEILSLKSNSWYRVQRFPHPLPFRALHSLLEDISHVYSNKTYRVMDFSIENENHYELMMSIDIPIENVTVELDVIRVCLSWTAAKEFRVGI